MRPTVWAAQQRILARLEAGLPRQRAVALQLRRLLPGAPEPTRPVEAQWLELSRLAPQDAVLQAWAIAQCGDRKACPTLDAQAWLRLEPLNAAAWSAWASFDPTQADAAYIGMAEKADHWRSHHSKFLAEAMAVLPTDEPGYVQVELMRWMNKSAENFDWVPLVHLTQRCRPPASSLNGRRLWCERVGGLLQSSPDALIERRLGELMLERAGLADPQRSDFRALSRVREAALEPPPQPWSCRAQLELAQRMQAMAQWGEVGAAVKWKSAQDVLGAGRGP
jgi:hypothetical protein